MQFLNGANAATVKISTHVHEPSNGIQLNNNLGLHL